MEIEEKIFKKYKPDFKRIKQFGFKIEDDYFTVEKIFQNGDFKATIRIFKDGSVIGEVIEKETGDIYLPLRVASQQGEFALRVRKNYENVLIKIRDDCFYKNCFVLAQSNRITDLIIKKYNANPEFLWEKSDGTGVFRNSKTNKWFGIIMDINKSRIDKTKKGFIEVMNVKLSAKTLENALKIKGLYPAYHMNKKYWITIALDDTVEDKFIMSLVEESYNLVDKK